MQALSSVVIFMASQAGVAAPPHPIAPASQPKCLRLPSVPPGIQQPLGHPPSADDVANAFKRSMSHMAQRACENK